MSLTLCQSTLNTLIKSQLKTKLLTLFHSSTMCCHCAKIRYSTKHSLKLISTSKPSLNNKSYQLNRMYYMDMEISLREHKTWIVR